MKCFLQRFTNHSLKRTVCCVLKWDRKSIDLNIIHVGQTDIMRVPITGSRRVTGGRAWFTSQGGSRRRRCRAGRGPRGTPTWGRSRYSCRTICSYFFKCPFYISNNTAQMSNFKETTWQRLMTIFLQVACILHLTFEHVLVNFIRISTNSAIDTPTLYLNDDDHNKNRPLIFMLTS